MCIFVNDKSFNEICTFLSAEFLAKQKSFHREREVALNNNILENKIQFIQQILHNTISSEHLFLLHTKSFNNIDYYENENIKCQSTFYV